MSLLRGLPAKIKYVRMGEVPGVRREQADEEVPRGLLSGGWVDLATALFRWAIYCTLGEFLVGSDWDWDGCR